jgi:ceramide glucosyltransferase
MIFVSVLLFAGAAIGLGLYAVQLGSVRRHLREPCRKPVALPAISILKPLCGIDDELELNLERFATLDYPSYELVLGVRDVRDAAYPIARAAVERWPGRVRLVVQRGEPGMNPKVNQLITLARAARHDILVVSDSNTRVEAGYLAEIAAHFEDPRVGLVTHPVVGVDEARLGSLMDNLHLAGSVGAGMIGAKRVARKDLVVGKSMALRRGDLESLGGFESVRDVLAEDFVLGKRVPQELGKRVAMARSTVQNVSCRRSAGDFLRRYRRWSVIHRFAVGPWVYAGQILLNPTVVGLAAFAACPSKLSFEVFGACAALKVAYDGVALKAMRGGSIPLSTLVASPGKDLLLGIAWVHGFLNRQVEWRSNRLRVLPGTILERPIRRLRSAHEPAAQRPAGLLARGRARFRRAARA